MFDTIANVVEIQTQGFGNGDAYVKSFKLQVSVDGTNWKFVEGGKEFTGNCDTNSIVTTFFETPI